MEILRARGDAVRVLDLRSWPGGSDAVGNVEVINGSITDPHIVKRAMDGVDRVFHLAGNPNLWMPNPAQFNEVNFVGTCRMLEEAGRLSLQRFVHTSTESILKSARARRNSDRALIDETVRLQIEDMPGPYCRSKFRAEEAAHAAAASGMPVVIVNPTMPLGPGDLLLTPPTKMLLGFLNGTTPAYLDCEFNLVDARDAAMGHLMAAERGRIGERYILGGDNLSLSDLLREISRLTGLKMPTWKVPYGIAYLSALISESIADITKKPPVAPLTGVKLARTSMAFDCSKAHRELTWKTRSLAQTLTDTLAWLRQAGLLTRDVAVIPDRG
ncbi:NAD-dependent epimerase/dehydratase family protein [Dongia soli]|uniref:NAD-dependent epimerase/dehydratase family protein n=1 Tax=Dongia soli TaxID=600628 RepID=A0ABU5E950_9PROT|nr:NAD-dependent epimerase/dehydratase family protein [Dongia soli]MDY0882853.1 NAD-dependent epimerase/dehydratase family protein [Dongia soli]